MNWMSAVRYSATVILAGLTAAYQYYPHMTWIPIAIAVLGTLGIHVIPSGGQSGATSGQTANAQVVQQVPAVHDVLPAAIPLPGLRDDTEHKVI